MSPPDLHTKLLEALSRVARSSAPEARLVIEVGPVYLLFISRLGESELHQEAVTSAALPAEHKLSSERAQILRTAGFTKRGGARRNWRRSHGRDLASLEGVAQQSADILTRAYGIDDTDSPSFTLVEDSSRHPENPDLLNAMRHLARARSDEARRAMYTELLNATFLVPLDPEVEVEAEDAYWVFDTSAKGRPMLGAFTDWQALRLWRPRGWVYTPVHGSELFEAVEGRHAATMKINPDGDVGGELYAHEVQTLVQALQTFRGRQN